MLGLFAGADENITPDQVAAFDAALPVEHEIHTYEGAPHSFFDRRQEAVRDASPRTRGSASSASWRSSKPDATSDCGPSRGPGARARDSASGALHVTRRARPR